MTRSSVYHPALLLLPLGLLLLVGGCSGGGSAARKYPARWVPSSEGIAGCCSHEVLIAQAPDGVVALSSGSTGIHLSESGDRWSRITVAPSGIERLAGITRRGTYIASVRDDSSLSVLITRDPRREWSHAVGVSEVEDLVEVGTTLYANDGNALVRSDDDGANWQTVRKPSYFGRHLVRSFVALGDRRLLALAGDSAIVRTDDGGETWRMVSESPVFDRDFPTRLSALANGKLFASGVNGLFASTDVGETWHQTLGFENPYVIEAGNRLLAACPAGALYGSPDDGENWIEVDRAALYRLAPTSDGTFYGYSWSSGFLRSADTRRWLMTIQSIDDCTVDALYAAENGDLYAGLSRTRARRRLMRSTDDGTSWTMVGDSLPSVVTSVIADGRRKIILGVASARRDSGDILVSTDGGAHWKGLGQRMAGSVTSITSGRDGTLYATLSKTPDAGVEGGGLLLSRDGGVSWTRMTIDRPLASLVETATGTLIVGESWPDDSGHTLGRVYRSTDKGKTFTPVLDFGEDNRRSGSDLIIDAAGTIFTCGGNMVHRSTDDGLTWKSTSVFPEEKLREAELYELTLDGAGALYVMTGYELHRSRDGGSSWEGPIKVIDNVGGLTALMTSRRGTLLAGTKRRGVFRSQPAIEE